MARFINKHKYFKHNALSDRHSVIQATSAELSVHNFLTKNCILIILLLRHLNSFIERPCPADRTFILKSLINILCEDVNGPCH